MCTLMCYNCHFSSPVFWKLEWFSFSALINTQCGSMYFAKFGKICSTVCNSFYSLTQEIIHNQTLSLTVHALQIFSSAIFFIHTISHADSPLVTLIYFGKVNVEIMYIWIKIICAFANKKDSTLHFPKSIGMDRIESMCETIYIWFDSKTNGRAWLSHFLL
jgi:hypothetical protein